ncbi:GNAT family N-acetyltransferase [Variovorax sp. HJSM1_2]|uniref:GNAT family N-acetyltransferase n=1 Tax=Variovorax sp. HJSM1_2 TaxID=3366263 RepID=UPI003BD4456B
MNDCSTPSQPREHVVSLRGGRSATIRYVQAADRSGFEDAFARLSPRSRYTRFFSPLRELSPSLLDAATQVQPDQSVAIVAVDGEGVNADIVGGARYAYKPDSPSCEFAVTVADNWQGLGLARQLMEALISLARAQGLQRMEGYVLPDNHGMRQLASRLGFVDTVCPGDRSLRLVSLDLG